MDYNIKKCPFCGYSADLWQNYSAKTDKFFVYCKCSVCGAQSRTFASEEEPSECDWSNIACENAVEAWNMRARDVEES